MPEPTSKFAALVAELRPAVGGINRRQLWYYMADRKLYMPSIFNGNHSS